MTTAMEYLTQNMLPLAAIMISFAAIFIGVIVLAYLRKMIKKQEEDDKYSDKPKAPSVAALEQPGKEEIKTEPKKKKGFFSFKMKKDKPEQPITLFKKKHSKESENGLEKSETFQKEEPTSEEVFIAPNKHKMDMELKE